MTILIVSSTEDPASTNMKKYLLKHNGWQDHGEIFNHPVYKNDVIDSLLVTIDDRHIRHENINREVSDNFDIHLHQLIVVSRHRSKTGEPTLTTHPLGNFGEARFGGRDRTFVKSSPRLMTTLLRLIKKHAKNNGLYHQVSFEATHHGPYVDIPALFAEVGSTEEEWRKEPPAKAIADAIFELLSKYKSEDDLPKDMPVLVGIGGGHYAPRFTDLVFEKKVAFGHMIPNYQIDAGLIDREILQKVFDATPGFDGVYIHRKALKKSMVRTFEEMLEEMDIKIWRSADLKAL
ncbi:MAG TPA: transposase [Thermoplasmatales archaeon]|nr:transposase [Thermoplasmatales archaeon]